MSRRPKTAERDFEQQLTRAALVGVEFRNQRDLDLHRQNCSENNHYGGTSGQY